jgi:hypothetical protein
VKKDRSKVLRDNAFSLAKRYEPSRVTETRKKLGDRAARKMAVAIALSEARRMGVKTNK